MSMIVAKCPLRVSLVGGSTDLDAFIQKYERGAVISFPSNLYCYISIHENNRGKYIINYTKKEEVDYIDDIKNDIARVVLKHFSVFVPVTVTFNTDIVSDGSGLAASSAYMVAAVKAVSMFKRLKLSEFEVCRIALKLERQFNPLTGYQDPYGCGIGGLKRMDFLLGKEKPLFRFFESEALTKDHNMYLIETGKKRNSTDVLKSIDISKSYELLDLVDELEASIEQEDFESFHKIMRDGWAKKKNTSSMIADDHTLQSIEKNMSWLLRSWKLCGAGGGGYFLAFGEKYRFMEEDGQYWALKDSLSIVDKSLNVIPINISETGVVGFFI